MTDTGVITGVSVAHSHADVGEIEAATVESEQAAVKGLLARDGVTEAFALETCNRVEAYVVTDSPNRGRTVLEQFIPEIRDGALVYMDHEESLRHLMRVAAGLESLVLGEDQILGQFKQAVAEARAVGGIGQLLDETLTKAVHVGERAREETAINEGATSLGSAAVDLAAEAMEGLNGATAMVIGAGEMGTLATRTLEDGGVERIVVANRTVPHAEHVAAELDIAAEPIGLDAAPGVVPEVDVIVSATGAPEPIFDAETFETAGETVIIDIGQPRDIPPEVGQRQGVQLHDIDALESVTAETREQRRSEAKTVEAMIDTEFDRLLEAFKRSQADDAIATMYEAAERTKQRELDEALEKLEAQGGLTTDQRETVEALADALVGQLLAAPTKSLREAAVEDDWTTIQTAMQLFNPEFDAPPERPPTGDAPDGLPEEPPEGMPDSVYDKLSDG